MRRTRQPGGRAGAGLAAAALAAVALSGCGQMGTALSQSWITIDFRPGTSVATAMQVRAACSHIAGAPPEAMPPGKTVADIMYGIRFDTTNASPAAVARLQTCVQKYPSVQGVDAEDAGDEGG